MNERFDALDGDDGPAGMTACPEVTVKRTPEGVVLRTSTCSYFDDAPTGEIRTRLRWTSDPPGLR